MRARWQAPALAAAACILLVGAAGEDVISRLLETPAAQIERGLPDRPLGDWLRRQLPPGAVPVYRTRRCPSAAGTCVNIEIDVISRARTLRLESALDPPRFLGGSVATRDGTQGEPIRSLAELPDRLAAPIRPEPLDCPQGTRNVLREIAAEPHEWCQDGTGRRHGPARSWYSAGRYLMSRGRYERGERTGLWTECDRFERCLTRTYP